MVRNRACHFEHAIVAARAEGEAGNRRFEKTRAVCVEPTVLPKRTARQPGVDTQRGVVEADIGALGARRSNSRWRIPVRWQSSLSGPEDRLNARQASFGALDGLIEANACLCLLCGGQKKPS